ALPTLVGVKNGDNITAGYDATSPTQASPVGTYILVPALADPGAKLSNYAVTANNGSLKISPAALTVSADSLSRPFGTPNPPLTGVIIGIKNNDNISAAYSTTATTTSAEGTYFIVPALVDTDLKLSNYTVTIKKGVLTITP